MINIEPICLTTKQSIMGSYPQSWHALGGFAVGGMCDRGERISARRLILIAFLLKNNPENALEFNSRDHYLSL